MKFRKAVDRIDPLRGSYCEGLRALEARDRKRVTCSRQELLAGSVNLDKALLRRRSEGEPVWDYVLGLHKGKKTKVFWVEFHPADTSNVPEVLKKLEWLLKWLSNEARPLKRLDPDGDFVWVASGRVRIRAGSPQARRLFAAGLRMPRERLDL